MNCIPSCRLWPARRLDRTAARSMLMDLPPDNLPPKSAIREIRINQNPFSAEYDKLGYGRIEIFTKPGTDQFHGQFMVNGNSSYFNSLNPFITDDAGLLLGNLQRQRQRTDRQESVILLYRSAARHR